MKLFRAYEYCIFIQAMHSLKAADTAREGKNHIEAANERAMACVTYAVPYSAGSSPGCCAQMY